MPCFSPTGVDAALGKAERDARREGRKLRCMRIVLWESGAWMYVLGLGACLAGAGAAVKRALADDLDVCVSCPSTDCSWEEDDCAVGTLIKGLLVRLFYPSIFQLWVILVKNAWTPLRYAVAPPPFVEREQLLEEEERMGKGTDEERVAYPKKEVREQHMEKRSQVFWMVVVVILVGEWLVFEGYFGYLKGAF